MSLIVPRRRIAPFGPITWPNQRMLVTSIALLAVYLLLDWGSYIYPYRNFNITPWNPVSGFAIFVLVNYGMRYLPVLYIGRVIANLSVPSGPESIPVVLLAAVLVIGGYALAARFYPRDEDFDIEAPNLRKVTLLLGGAAIISATVATAYVGLLFVTNILPMELVVSGVLRRFVGDFIGIITLVPPLSLLFKRFASGRRPIISLSWHGAIPAILMLALELIIFGVPWIDDFKYFYLLFLPMTWMAVQGGFSGAAFGVLWTQVGGIMIERGLGTLTGSGITEIQVLMTTLTVTALLLGTVVSERRDAETRLSNSQTELDRVSRFSISGELASVIAHELNQPLTAITNYARVSQMLHDGDGSAAMLRDTLEKTLQQATRAGEIIRRLRDFVKRGDSSPEDLLLNDVMNEVIEIMSPLLRGSGIVLQSNLAANLPIVFADRLQIHQVVYNLIRNAVEAMSSPEIRFRRLRIETYCTEDGDAAGRIVDSGSGLSPDVQARLFTPFVTSKTSGMGLGLSISKSIVAAHGGKLWHEEQNGQGAIFCFSLPAGLSGAFHDD